MDSPFHGGLNGTPLVGGEVFGESGRCLECVGCGDFIVALVLLDFFIVIVANALLLRRPFVGGKWRVFLAGDDR